MSGIARIAAAGFAALVVALTAATADAKDKVKVGFIGPLTGGVSVNGIGGRNSADLAVKLRNADPKSKYEYELVVLDDECKPNVAVQVATRMAADKDIIAGATHYCSVAGIAAVDTYHKFGFPVIVWGAVLPDITYRKVPGDSSRQRHNDQPERRQRGADLQSRLQDCGGDPRHHRLRQGP
jgi:branched-chain amino acid transport system substrate-binding protein